MVAHSDMVSFIAQGRSEMDGMFTDRCRITRPGPGGRGPLNPATGVYDQPGERVTVYEGRCRLQVKADINSNVVETTAGDREWTYLTAQLQLPSETHPDDIGDVDAVDVDQICDWLEAPFSPSLVGTRFNIQGPYHKSQAVYLRFRVRELVA